MKQYISIDPDNNIADTTVKMTSDGNEFCGTFKTVEKSGEEPKDIKDIFVKKQDFDEIKTIEESEGISIDDLVTQINKIICSLKGVSGTASLLVLLSCVPFMSFGQDNGKALLGTLNSKKHCVVTNEVDPVFSAWKDKWTQEDVWTKYLTISEWNNWVTNFTPVMTESDPIFSNWADTNEYVRVESDPKFTEFINGSSEISIGKDASAKGDGRFDDVSLSVAIGSPLNAISSWNTNFTKNTEAMYKSVAIGTAAKAKQRVSVAIGNQANIGELHWDTGNMWTYELKNILVTNELDSSGNVVSATTNRLENTIETVDSGRYERMPTPTGTYTTIESETIEIAGTKYKIQKMREKSNYIEDLSWVDKPEYDMYNREFDPGQGRMNYRWATYGVAIGSRSQVSGHHSVAFGHYARAIRPHSVALGPGNWVEAEGSISVGYDSDIDKKSPYSLAVGSRSYIPSGMTNAIVIGVPIVDYSKRQKNKDEDMSSPYVWASQPKAMKSNSINIVYNGDGLKDFFVDSVSLPDRLASETPMIGNVKNGGDEDSIRRNVKLYGGISDDDKSMVFCSGDGGIILLTKDYLDQKMDQVDNFNSNGIVLGNCDNIIINGMPLSRIIEKYSSKTDNDESKFEAYHTTVTNQARIAYESITNSTNLSEIKSALTNFFNSIK